LVISSSLVYLAFEPWITGVHDELAGTHKPAQLYSWWNYRSP